MIRRAVAVALTLVLGACSTGVPAPRTPAYLTQIEPIAREINRTIADTRTAIDQQYDSPTLFVDALIDVRLGIRLAIERDRLRRLEPPAEFATDHEQYLELVDTLLGIARDVDAALASDGQQPQPEPAPTPGSPGRAAETARAVARLEAAAGIGFAGLSAATCRFASFDLSLCAEEAFFSPDEVIAHRALERAAAVYQAYDRLPASVAPRDATSVAAVVANEVTDELWDTARILDGLGDDRMMLLADEMRRVAAITGDLPNNRFTVRAVNERLETITASICEIAPRFPPPDPLPAEGGTTVVIDGFAEVWFSYAGRCER